MLLIILLYFLYAQHFFINTESRSQTKHILWGKDTHKNAPSTNTCRDEIFFSLFDSFIFSFIPESTFGVKT